MRVSFVVKSSPELAMLDFWNVHIELAVRLGNVRLLGNQFSEWNIRVRALSITPATMIGRRSHAPLVDHIKDTTNGLVPVRIPTHPLLLAAKVDPPLNLDIRHEATTGIASSIPLIIFKQIKVATDMHSSQGSCLGNSVDHITLDLGALDGAPEVIEGSDVVVGGAVGAVDVGDGDIGRRVTQTQYLGVEADLDVDVVGATFKHDSIAAITELAVDVVATVLAEDFVDNPLCLGRIVRWIDNFDELRVPERRVGLHGLAQEAS